ncbi:MAG: DNA cytosine methyltransferase [Clostridia bacterium]|nr:DNA cytosine methyltransferase [Clostridia bacterium]
MINALSLFAGIGVGEFYLDQCGINVVLANEIVRSRAEAHSILHPKCEVLTADITKEETQNEIIKKSVAKNVEMVIATPPCQGLSTAGSNKTEESLLDDPRNFLILSALKIVDALAPKYFVIENVPRFQQMLFPYENKLVRLIDLLKAKYSEQYHVRVDVFNAAEYGVPQTRFRVVYRLWKKGFAWNDPKKKPIVTLKDAIGDLPSLEPGEKSSIKNHYALMHPQNHIECMRHTPTGKSAFKNEEFFPKKPDGSRIKGYGNSYKRMRWDAPAPTITMRNEIVSSQENVHPGRPLGNGVWSDARVLTLRELLIVSSLPADLDKPENLTETAFRQLIGEGIPPVLMKEIMNGINDTQDKTIALSMFSGGGIAETYFESVGIHVAVANELLPERAKFYSHVYPNTKMICGSIADSSVFESVMTEAKNAGVKFILATPPCQGMSTLGKRNYESDSRNSLIKYVLKAIDRLDPDYVMIENVPKFVELLYDEDGSTYYVDSAKSKQPYRIVELLQKRFGSKYNVEMKILNAMNYGVPQSRPRVIIKVYKKGLSWSWPEEDQHVITLREAIGDLPSLESGERSGIKWHNALRHNARQIEALRHTPEGKSAMKNEVYYPKKADGTRVKGFHNTYNRMRWDEPAPARTTNNHLISGHNNVHPGRLLPDGTWSDARVLTFRELVIVSSLPLDWNIPNDFPEADVRIIIGEAIPPLLSKKIAEQIGR